MRLNWAVLVSLWSRASRYRSAPPWHPVLQPATCNLSKYKHLEETVTDQSWRRVRLGATISFIKLHPKLSTARALRLTASTNPRLPHLHIELEGVQNTWRSLKHLLCSHILVAVGSILWADSCGGSAICLTELAVALASLVASQVANLSCVTALEERVVSLMRLVSQNGGRSNMP